MVYPKGAGEYLVCQPEEGGLSHMHHCGERGTNNHETGQNAPDAGEVGHAYTAYWANSDACEGPWQSNRAKGCDIA